MKTLTVSEFIKKAVGKTVDTIQTGSEMVLLGECNKYLNKMDYNLTVDTEVDERLFTSLSKKRMIAQGVIWGTEKFEPYNDNIFFKDSVETVVFRHKDDTEWVYDFQADPVANRVMKSDRTAQANLSLFAYLLVNNFINDVKAVLTIKDNTCLTPKEYTQLYVLAYYGNKWGATLINGIGRSGDDWFAYVEMNRQYGYMCRPYLPSEKANLATELFGSGDVVLLYTRTKGRQQDDRVRNLEKCEIAVIKSIDSKGVSLLKVPNAETILTTQNRLDRCKSEGGTVTYDDYTKFYTPTVNYDWYSMGVEQLVYEEDMFISKIQGGDVSYQVLMMPNGIEEMALDPFDTVYAVLENRGISYNREGFLAEYFPNSVPLYERYRSIQPTKYERGTKKQIEDKYLGRR